MSDRTPLLEQLARRNPVPQPADPPSGAWDLATVRHELMRRETAMDTLEKSPKTRPGAPPPRGNGWLIAAAAFAVVIVVGLVAFLGGGDSSPTTVAPVASSTTEAPTTATTTDAPVDLVAEAEAFVEAIYTNDVATIEAMASPTANLQSVIYFAGFVEQIIELSNGEILGWTCTTTVASNLIHCEVDYVEDTVRAAGFDRLTESWDIGFALGRPQSMTFESAADDPIAMWLEDMADQHPEWLENGGPCEGIFGAGDPVTCVPVLLQFVAEQLTANG